MKIFQWKRQNWRKGDADWGRKSRDQRLRIKRCFTLSTENRRHKYHGLSIVKRALNFLILQKRLSACWREGKIYPFESTAPKNSKNKKAFLSDQCKEIEETQYKERTEKDQRSQEN